MEDGLGWRLGPGSCSYLSRRKEQLAPLGNRWAAVGLAGWILAGFYLSTSDQAQTWSEDPKSLPWGDVSVERARA